MDETLPRKRSRVYTKQYNLKIDEDLKNDLVYLDGQEVDVPELLRPAIRAIVDDAKRKILAQAG